MKRNVSKNLHCICGICFNSRTTLWRHKKVCKSENDFVVIKNVKYYILKIIMNGPKKLKKNLY